MPEGFVGLPPDSTGKKLRTRQRVVGANTVDEQFVIVQDERLITYRGRAATWRVPGRAGTTGATLLQLFNGAGSGVLVEVETVTIDTYSVAAKAATVPPAVIRLYRTTSAATGGTALPKGAMDTAQTSAAAVALLQDASADGTSSGTALGATVPAGSVPITQEIAPRVLTAVGYEMADRMEFLNDNMSRPLLREGQGVVLRLDYAAATTNPVGDQWVATVRWSEFTLP